MQAAEDPTIARLEAEVRRLADRLRAAGIDPATGGSLDAGVAFADGSRDGVDRALLDAMSEGVYAMDPQGRVVVCNRVAALLLGFPAPDALIGRDIHALIHHSHPDGTAYPHSACPIHRAAQDGVPALVDHEVFFRADGTSFPVEYRAEPIYREGGLHGAVCTFTDISARLQAETALRESRERLDLAAKAGGIGVWSIELPGGQLEWDDRVRALFGIASGGAITLQANLDAVHADDRARVSEALNRALDPGGDGRYSVQFRAVGLEDGHVRWLDAQGQATFRDGAARRLLGVLRDVSDAKAAEHHQRLLVNELNHRVKNSLAMVQGLAAQTLRNTDNVEDARERFTQRVVALARAHDVLTASHWESADLRHLMDLTVETLAGDAPGQFSVAGEPLQLSAKTALSFSLALHELGTNAVKYGALSVPSGRVAVAWSAAVAASGQRVLRFTWREFGGPVVHAPQRRGFGTKLLERGLAAELGGVVRLSFPSGGVVCSIEAPFPTGVDRQVS